MRSYVWMKLSWQKINKPGRLETLLSLASTLSENCCIPGHLGLHLAFSGCMGNVAPVTLTWIPSKWIPTLQKGKFPQESEAEYQTRHFKNFSCWECLWSIIRRDYVTKQRNDTLSEPSFLPNNVGFKLAVVVGVPFTLLGSLTSHPPNYPRTRRVPLRWAFQLGLLRTFWYLAPFT